MQEHTDILEIALNLLEERDLRHLARKELQRELKAAVRQTEHIDQPVERLVGHVVERLQRSMSPSRAVEFAKAMVDNGVDPRSLTRQTRGFSVDTLGDIANAIVAMKQRNH